MSKNAMPLGIGCYSIPEAARLLKIDAASIRRWVSGYSYKRGNERHRQPALWPVQWPQGRSVELGFRDLMELRFVAQFLEIGLSLQTIRTCLRHARDSIGDDHPLSTRRFQTDGRTIFLEGLKEADVAVLDLKHKQYALRDIIARTFRDLDFDESGKVMRWRPFHGRKSIIVDPARAFGQPIHAGSGIPTLTLAQAFEAEGSEDIVANLYDVSIQVVRDAISFEKELLAA